MHQSYIRPLSIEKYDSNYKINHEIYSVKEDQNLNKLILNEINIYKWKQAQKTHK